MAAVLSLAYTATPLAAGVQACIYASGPVSAGVNFVPRGRYKLLQVTAAAAASPANLLTAYQALFGALTAGQKVFVKVILINSLGLASAPTITSEIVT